MDIFQKITKTFSDDKSTSPGERDQVIREAKKKTRLLRDGEWIRNKQSDEPQSLSTDVNFGKSALNRVTSEENLNRDSSKVTTPTKSDTIDGRKRDTSGTVDSTKTRWTSNSDKPARDSDSTDVASPTKKYSTLDRFNRTSQIKMDDLPKMTIITSEPKTGSPTSKSLQSRSSPDGQVTSQEKTSSKTTLKWNSQKDDTPGNNSTSKISTLERKTVKTSTKSEPAPLIDLTPTTEKSSKGLSDILPKFGSQSLIDLSITSEKPNERTPDATSVRTSSLFDLTPTAPDKPKRSSGEWDNITSSTTTSTKATFEPTSRKSSRSSGDWDKTNSYTTTSTKTTFNPTSRSSSNNDGDNTNSYITTSTKTTFDPDTKTSSYNSSNDKSLVTEEPPYSSRSAYKENSYNSSNDKSPVTEELPYSSRSSYKENSPPFEQPYDDDESLSYRSLNNSLQRNRNSSSSLSDGKGPAKVITLTTAYTSAGQTTKDKNVCSQCYKPFNNAAKMILEDLNINCHASCLKCQICHQSLENLNAGDNIWVHHHTVHCEKCYDEVKAQLGF